MSDYISKTKHDLIEIIEHQQERIAQYQENNAERLMLSSPLKEQNKHLEQSLAEHKAMVGELVEKIEFAKKTTVATWGEDALYPTDVLLHILQLTGTLTKAKQLQENTK